MLLLSSIILRSPVYDVSKVYATNGSRYLTYAVVRVWYIYIIIHAHVHSENKNNILATTSVGRLCV